MFAASAYPRSSEGTSVPPPNFAATEPLNFANWPVLPWLQHVSAWQEPWLAAQAQEDFHTAGGAKFAEHGGNLMLDRARRARQELGGFLVALARRDESEHLLFVLRQTQGVTSGGPIRAPSGFRQLARNSQTLRLLSRQRGGGARLQRLEYCDGTS